VPTSLSRIETFSPLDRNLLQLPNLPNQLLPLSQLMRLLIPSPFQPLIQVGLDQVTHRLVLSFLVVHFAAGVVLLVVDLCNDGTAGGKVLLDVRFPLVLPFICLNFHLNNELFVFLFLPLLGNNGFFSSQLHLNLLFLNVLEPLNFIFSIHLSFPPVELGGVLEPHGHLGNLLILLLLLLLQQVLLALHGRHIDLNSGWL